MADIFHDFVVKATPQKIFEAITTPEGLNAWWTKKSSGRPEIGEDYQLWFGPEYDWRGKVTQCNPPVCFELQMTKADQDWENTRVGFQINPQGEYTQVSFYQTGWPSANDHWRISNYCWAMYLRLLRRYVEQGEVVSYEYRLEV